MTTADMLKPRPKSAGKAGEICMSNGQMSVVRDSEKRHASQVSLS
jgi:hypothetical protein